MSASEVHRRATKALTAKRDVIAARIHLIRYEFPQMGADGAVIAPPTAENIAMRTIEATAAVRTYDDAIAIIDEIFREMTAPDKGTSRTVPDTQREAPYQ